MKILHFLSAVSLLGFASKSLVQANDADKQFEKKFDAKIVKIFNVDNPTEGLAGGTSIAVAYSGSFGEGQKYYVVYCEKNDQDGYGSSWIYRSADDGATWTQVQPADKDVPDEYKNANWRTGKPTFASRKAWIRMAAYEDQSPKSFPRYLSGYWSSTNTSVCSYSGSNPEYHKDTAPEHWVVSTGSNRKLDWVPVCVVSDPIVGDKLDDSDMPDGLVESGSNEPYSCRYEYGYRFKVPRQGWGSGHTETGPLLTGTDTYRIITSTIQTGTDGRPTEFDAAFYYNGIKKRTFVRKGDVPEVSPTSTEITSYPHSRLEGPRGMAPFVPPAAVSQPDGLAPDLLLSDLKSAEKQINSGFESDNNALRDGTYLGSLFFYDGSAAVSSGTNNNIGLYLISMGRSNKGRKLYIRKSIDAGVDWSDPEILSNVPGDYVSSAPAIYEGRVWVAFGATQVMSASLADNLMDRASWIVSEDSKSNGVIPRVPHQANWLQGKPPKDLNFRVINSGSGNYQLVTAVNDVFPTNKFTESCVVAGPVGSGESGVWLLPKISGQPYTAKIGITVGVKGVDHVLTTEFTGTGASDVTLVGQNPFDPSADIIYLPGAEKKFIAQYVPGPNSQRGKFYALTNPQLEPYQCSRLADRNGNAFASTPEQRFSMTNYENSEGTRNTGAIYSSTNLIDWQLEKIFVHSAAAELINAQNYGKVREGFSTFSFAIDGDDMLIASRTAADIGQRDDAFIKYDVTGTNAVFSAGRFPRRGLDANLVSFHRVKNFRSLARDTFLAADKDGNKVYIYEASKGDPAKVGEFLVPNSVPVMSPSGIAQLPGASGEVFVSNSVAGGTIERYSREGAFLSTLYAFSSTNTPVALATGTTSNLLYATVASGTSTQLCKFTVPESGTTTPTFFSAVLSSGTTVNLTLKSNGLAVASSGFLYGTLPGGFARISTSGATVATGTRAALAFSQGAQGLIVAQTGTNSGTWNLFTLSNLTLAAKGSTNFPEPISGMVQSGTSLLWTGSSSAGWEVLPIP